MNILDGHMLADGPLPDKAMKMQHPHGPTVLTLSIDLLGRHHHSNGLDNLYSHRSEELKSSKKKDKRSVT
jgi:hypothetical protein